MRICKHLLEYAQVMDQYGTVRMCPWLKDVGIIGSLLEKSFEEIWNGERANKYRQMLIEHDFSNCNVDECPYLANDAVEEVEVEEIPRFPSHLAIAFERACNYRCSCCYIKGQPNMTSADYEKHFAENYNKIETEIRNVMPYATTLDSNGLAELFCSKRALKLIKEWEPLAPKNECTILMETNGSLFNESMWKSLGDIKDFNIKVSITVMSFEEKVYQELSGTKLPISQIENNLDFISSMRKKNIINYLQLNTVYQEKNFRFMPELVKRFLEYGADYVRLRPYAPMDEDREEIMWFKDVRNQYHPYHKEFLNVWSNPILKNEKVHDWGGRKNSLLGKYPAVKEHKKLWILNDLMMGRAILDAVYDRLENAEVVIYGCGTVGKILAQVLMENKITVKYFVDQYTNLHNYKGIPVYRLRKTSEKSLCLISIVENREWKIDDLQKKLHCLGYCNAMALSNLVND